MKKFIAIILSITLLFSFMALPVSAELGDSDASININEAKSIFERIADVFHNLVANLFKIFGLDCPLCENHDGYGEAEGDGDFNKAEIAKKYNDAVNQLKAHKKKLTITHKSYMKPTVEEAPSSIKKAIENVLDNFAGNDIETLTFKNNESAEIAAVIPPSDKEANLSGAYIDYINFQNYNDDTKIEFRLMDSESTFDGTKTTLPEGYADVLNPVNLDNLSDVIAFTHADITYTDTNVEAILNINGKVKSLKTSTTITVNATVKTGATPSVVKIKLECADEYNMNY